MMRSKKLLFTLELLLVFCEAQDTSSFLSGPAPFDGSGAAENNPYLSENTDFEKCQPCDGEIDPSKSFDGLSCEEWLSFASQVPANTEECALERLLGWKHCGCPAQTEETCTFCENGDSSLVQWDLALPFSSITCGTFVDVPALDGETTCKIAHDFSYYCGCPNVQPQCTLCDDGAPPQNLDAPLYLGMTCADIEALYLVSSELRCGDLEQDYPFDLQAYCGCNNVQKPNHGCSFCPYQGVLNNLTQTLISDPTSTCETWANLASYAKEGESSCAVFQYVGLECCDSMVLPGFFADFLEEQETMEQEQPQQPQQESSSNIDEGASQGEQYSEYIDEEKEVEGGFDPNDLAIPFTAAIPSPSSADNVSSAIYGCFKQYTKISSNVGDSSLNAVSNETLSENAPGELGNLFTVARTGHGQAENDSDVDSYAAAEYKIFDSQRDKWEQLMEQLEGYELPPEFKKIKRSDEFANHTFLPGLSECVISAVDAFTECNLCPDGSKPTMPQKMIPIVGLYCDEYDAWRSDATYQDCKSLESWLPFDMASWCGCPGVPDPPIIVPASVNWNLPNEEQENKGCSFCPEGMVLVLESWKQTVTDRAIFDGGYEEDATCAEWSQMADYANSEDGCSFLHRIARSGCCEYFGASILDRTPSPLPIVSGTVIQPPTASPTAMPFVETISTVSSGGASFFLLANTGLIVGMSLLAIMASV